MFNLDGFSNSITVSIRDYYAGHLPRFKYMEEVFSSLENIKLVYDLGTPIPFASYILAEKGARVVYGCQTGVLESGMEGCIPITFDFNKLPFLLPSDLVICTECLEHLSCNLLTVRDYLKGLVKKGGYLFLSFPTGGICKGSWSDVLPPSNGLEHQREFSRPLARQFCEEIGFTIISEKCFKVPNYPHGEGIDHFLMRNV